jgi:hypothetical protein
VFAFTGVATVLLLSFASSMVLVWCIALVMGQQEVDL